MEARLPAGTQPGPPLAQQKPQVHVVDDDAGVRRALARLLATCGYELVEHRDAESVLSLPPGLPHGCMILDVALPGLDGIELQQRLLGARDALPIVFVSGWADVAACATAMRMGAVDFLTKPVEEEHLLKAVAAALEIDARRRSRQNQRETVGKRLAALTKREREVLARVMAGRLNKQIAADLGLAEKTVKVHRARGLHKMEVRSAVELLRVLEGSELSPDSLSEIPR